MNKYFQVKVKQITEMSTFCMGLNVFAYLILFLPSYYFFFSILKFWGWGAIAVVYLGGGWPDLLPTPPLWISPWLVSVVILYFTSKDKNKSQFFLGYTQKCCWYYLFCCITKTEQHFILKFNWTLTTKLPRPATIVICRCGPGCMGWERRAPLDYAERSG